MNNSGDITFSQFEQFMSQLMEANTPDDVSAGLTRLDLVCEKSQSLSQIISAKYLPELYKRDRSGQSSFLFIASSTLELPLRHLALATVKALVTLYVESQDQELLVLIVRLLLRYKFVDFLDLESTGQNLRIEINDASFYLNVDAISRDYRLALMKLALTKYTDALVTVDSLPQQELPALIQRLNSVIDSLLQLAKSPELSKRPALVPFSEPDLRHGPDRSRRLFGDELDPEQYDEQLFRDYRVPLFPVIQADRLSFSGDKVSFTNEGLGCLPAFTLRVQALSNEFELGVVNRTVAPTECSDIFVEEIAAFASFLKGQKVNADIKVVFAFRKFGRHYEFGVLANAVGNWFEQIPLQARDTALPHEIPLQNLPERDFERLCYWIVSEYPQQVFEKAVWLNENGGGERGRDILATERKTGKHYVFQCKRVEDFGPSDVEKELTQFAGYIKEDPSIKPDVYVLVLSTALTDRTRAKAEALAVELDMEIDYWPKSTIDRLVRTNRVIYDRFWRELPMPDVQKKSSSS